MLESALKEQLKGIFAGLEANFTFDISVSSSHENKTELLELLGDVADCSDHITCVVNEGDALKFTLLKNGDRTGITFWGIPNGHEFTSLLLAVLNLDGKGKNFPDEDVYKRQGKNVVAYSTSFLLTVGSSTLGRTFTFEASIRCV